MPVLCAKLDNEHVCKLKWTVWLHSSDFFLFLCGAKSMKSFWLVQIRVKKIYTYEKIHVGGRDSLDRL